MKLEALDHPKTLDLASRLRVEVPTAIGYLELLWAFTGKKAQQGNVGKWPDGAIAVACYWRGESADFIAGLVAAGYLDRHAEHRLVVHDWHDHAPNWVKAKLSKASQLFLTHRDVSASVSGSVSASVSGSATSRTRTDTPTDTATDTTTDTGSSRARVLPSEVKGSEAKTLRARVSTDAGTSEPGKGREGAEPPHCNAYGAMSIALRERNVNVTSIHPTLVAWVDEGFTVDQVLGALAKARETKGDNERISAAYLDPIVRAPPRMNGSPSRARVSGNGEARTHAQVMAAIDALPPCDEPEFPDEERA